MAYMTQRKK